MGAQFNWKCMCQCHSVRKVPSFGPSLLITHTYGCLYVCTCTHTHIHTHTIKRSACVWIILWFSKKGNVSASQCRGDHMWRWNDYVSNSDIKATTYIVLLHALYTCWWIYYPLQSYKIGSNMIPVSQMKTLSHRAVKWLGQDHSVKDRAGIHAKESSFRKYTLTVLLQSNNSLLNISPVPGTLLCWWYLTCPSLLDIVVSNREGNGTPLQCSCLENPRDGGAWWAAVYGVAQSRTQLKRLSSSSSS